MKSKASTKLTLIQMLLIIVGIIGEILKIVWPYHTLFL